MELYNKDISQALPLKYISTTIGPIISDILNIFVQGQRWAGEGGRRVLKLFAQISLDNFQPNRYTMLERVKERKLNIIQTFDFSTVLKEQTIMNPSLPNSLF